MISLPQLQSFGLTPSAVRQRVAAGRLTRIHRGVYAVGHARLTGNGRWMAAVLAYGDGAVLSHRSAAALHGIRPGNRATADITLPSRSARPRSGIHVHKSSTLTAADVTAEDGIPCTSVARTLLDLAGVVDDRGVEKAIDQAVVLRNFDRRAVEDVLRRATGRSCASRLERVLDEYRGPTLTDEELEERFLALCRQASLPTPSVNEWVVLDDGVAYKADFLWRAERVIVETDGWGTHGTRRAFESDRKRDRRLRLAGWEVIRFTWRDVEREPDEVRAFLARFWRTRSAAPLR